MTERARLRIDVWCEDTRQESFIRQVLVERGFSKRRMEFHIAPKGDGSAEQWVLREYANAMRRLRSRNYQHHLGLVVMRDGDRVGFARRVAEMDAVLDATGLAKRAAGERVALPFPQWSVESWLLALLGHEAGEEKADKARFEAAHGAEGVAAVKQAASRWAGHSPRSASMTSADAEFGRLG